MLTFNLKKEWFEKIKSGEKTHEYRELKPYWTKRIDKEIKLLYKQYGLHAEDKFIITFMLGYPKNSEKDKILKAIVKSIRTENSGLDTDLKIDKPVYDIEFELIKEVLDD